LAFLVLSNIFEDWKFFSLKHTKILLIRIKFSHLRERDRYNNQIMLWFSWFQS
jgi:hypothetical protein